MTSPPTSNDDANKNVTDDNDADTRAPLTGSERLRFAIYAVVFIGALGALAWQMWPGGDRGTPIAAGVNRVSVEQIQEVSTPESPIYWLGTGILPGGEVITMALPGKTKTDLNRTIRGMVIYDSSRATAASEQQAAAEKADAEKASTDQEPSARTGVGAAGNAAGTGNASPEHPLSFPYASVQTRELTAEYRTNLERALRECADNTCPSQERPLRGPWGTALVGSDATGGWMARYAEGNALIIVSGGKPLLPAATLKRVQPIP